MVDNIWKQKRVKSAVFGPGTPCAQCAEEIDKYCPEWTVYCFQHSNLAHDPVMEELSRRIEEIDEFMEERI